MPEYKHTVLKFLTNITNKHLIASFVEMPKIVQLQQLMYLQNNENEQRILI